MSRASLVARAQAAALRSMTSRCTITRTASVNENLTTGQATDVVTTLYTGVCRMQQRVAEARPEQPGEAYVRMLHREVQLPMTVTGLAVGDLVTIVSSPDADLVGRKMRIRDLAGKDEASARRVVCEEVTS